METSSNPGDMAETSEEESTPASESERMKYFRKRKERELARRRRNRILLRACISALAVCAVILIAVRTAKTGGTSQNSVEDSVILQESAETEEPSSAPSGGTSGQTAETETGDSSGETETGLTETETDPAETGSDAEADLTEEPESEEEEDPRTDVWNHYTNMFIAVTSEGYLNIRDQPSSSGMIVGRLLKYSGGEVLEDTGTGWLHIQSGDIEGYVSAEFCVTGEEAKQLALDHCYVMVKVNAERLNVRSGPGEEYPVWTQLGSSALQTWLGEENGWYEIAINDTNGYISMDYAEKGCYLKTAMPWSSVSKYSETRQKIFSYGEQFLGVPYVYGGTSLTTGLDCSSFVQQVYQNAIGISLPRTSREQVNCGAAVASLAEAKAGDLLFYCDAQGVIDHVAIYMGDYKILHCSLSQGGVVITAYNYSTEPVAIRDVIQD